MKENHLLRNWVFMECIGLVKLMHTSLESGAECLDVQHSNQMYGKRACYQQLQFNANSLSLTIRSAPLIFIPMLIRALDRTRPSNS